jgi:tetratricopeptide (TPR) repeat protein
VDWKNDGTLFAADLKVAPNSILVNANVAASLISKADLVKDEKEKDTLLYNAIAMLDKTINLHRHTFVAGFLNRGIAWYKLGDIDKAKANMDTVKTLYPNYPTLKGMYALLSDHYMKKGWDSFGRVGRFPEAIIEFKKGLSFDSTNPQLWYNLGGAYYSNHQLPEAINAWQVSLKLKPDNVQAQQGLQAAMGMLNEIQAGKMRAAPLGRPGPPPQQH